MHDEATYLKEKIANHKLLTKVAGKGDHVGAGLSIVVTVGSPDSETAVPIHLNIAHDTQEVLDLLISSHKKSMAFYVKLLENENKRLQESLTAYKDYASQG